MNQDRNPNDQRPRHNGLNSRTPKKSKRGRALWIILAAICLVVLLFPKQRALLTEQSIAMPKQSATNVNATAESGSNTATARNEVNLSELNEPADRKSVILTTQGTDLLGRGRIEEAIAAFQAAAALDPNDEDIQYNLGIAFAKAGKVDQAIHHYSEALKIFPDYAEAHNNLGNLLVKKGRIGESIEHFKLALTANPQNPVTHNNLGTALGNQGKFNEAITCFSEATRLNPNYVEARYNLGNAYAAQSRWSEAVVEFSTVLQMKPDFSAAAQALGKARHKLALQQN